MGLPTSASAKEVPTPTSLNKDITVSAPPVATDDAALCEACVVHDRPFVARIRSPSHFFLALRLLVSDPQRRRDLFTNWIHIPLGITSLLFLVWLIKLAMDRAPFRFPSPVLAMVFLFALLLSLDGLSSCSSSLRSRSETRGYKVLLQPVLVVLEAPCDFCLRYMSVMFTPSFILIPAREVINGREIGLITGWFAASQLLALVFPVLLHKALHAVVRLTKARVQGRKQRKEVKEKRAQEQRRASVATLVAVMSNINPRDVDGKKEGLGADGKVAVLDGGDKLGSVATGLSGMTAIATAPLTVSTSAAVRTGEIGNSQLRHQASQQQDAQRQLEHVQFETARQQGDPYATSRTPVSESHHHYPLLHTSPHRPHLHDSFNSTDGVSLDRDEERVGRCQSRARSWTNKRTNSAKRASSSCPPHRKRFLVDADAKTSTSKNGHKSGEKVSSRPQSAGVPPTPTQTPTGRAAISPTFDEFIFHTRRDLLDRQASSSTSQSVRELDLDPQRQQVRRSIEKGTTLVMPTLAPPTPTRLSQEVQVDSSEPGCCVSRKLSKADSEITIHLDDKPQPSTYPTSSSNAEKAAAVVTVEEDEHQRRASTDEVEMDAIDRLVETLWSAIPWLVFSLVLIVGVPIFYLLDISLPLFLALNVLMFLCSITIVPPMLRRYLHPILTTSIATVLLLWAIGAVRGWSLQRTLQSYSVDAKYSVLWSLTGYHGPVIGAGDVLFSTLDAGIVSLAIPMYRYRWDLWHHLADMLAVLFPCSLLSLFVWPTVAAAIGIAPERALAFTSRFMSTPLAIEMSLTIGADQSITVILVVITGILISIFKDPFFRLLKLDPTSDGPNRANGVAVQDYLTIGIAMGSTAGAIGASSLISKPRSMAIASLSFVLFGAILLIFAAIPPIVETVRTLASAPSHFNPRS